jgi:hypothetical protein
MAATWDSAYLLSLFNRKAGRPATDSITDVSKYQRLSESQNRVIAMIASVAPYSLYPKVAYGSFPTLSTTDNQVFTFGTDSNGYAITPIGKTGIYPTLNSIPDFPWRENDDYLNEGSQIRIPDNRTYSGTLYWRGVTQPADIDATHQPSIIPEGARELIVIDAVRQFSEEGARNSNLAALMLGEWNTAWPTWCLAWKTSFRQGGALGNYTARQIASTTTSIG